MTDKELLDRFKKEICEYSLEVTPSRTSRYDWHDLSVGYFLALIPGEYDRSKDLARKARYTYQYWSGEPNCNYE